MTEGGKVIQFPTRSPREVRCECGRVLQLGGYQFLPVPLDAARLEAITFHVRCECGQQWQVTKRVKG